ncbi:hypothetical protein [Streptomyces chattanoogensis]|uniref:Uncharacterized protein n=1 Tax=Streptomyces chattanoogensis TaxID=66876 RepID=A0A0N1JYK5_9ACTN|nr:hypothetical protein [Streptomyces chattanoogensis]KPC65253.1 hypothetical protein ADL29_07775 [Streptomyces chattanoogensis]
MVAELLRGGQPFADRDLLVKTSLGRDLRLGPDPCLGIYADGGFGIGGVAACVLDTRCHVRDAWRVLHDQRHGVGQPAEVSGVPCGRERQLILPHELPVRGEQCLAMRARHHGIVAHGARHRGQRVRIRAFGEQVVANQ